MSEVKWKEVEKQSGKNTALAFGTTEYLISSTLRVDSYNSLLVQNFDAVQITIYLDGDISGVTGKEWIVPSNFQLQIEPGDGIWFSKILQKNNSGATNEVANTVLCRVAKAVRVD